MTNSPQPCQHESGALMLVWRLEFDPIMCIIRPLKPLVCTRCELKLQANKPIRVEIGA